ncbi:hypothetical protein M9458_050320, partial [Cirrhinus mrigala]
PPVAPAFGNVSSSVSEDGALISWEYWGPEKHLYVEYIIDNSKNPACVCREDDDDETLNIYIPMSRAPVVTNTQSSTPLNRSTSTLISAGGDP